MPGLGWAENNKGKARRNGLHPLGPKGGTTGGPVMMRKEQKVQYRLFITVSLTGCGPVWASLLLKADVPCF